MEIAKTERRDDILSVLKLADETEGPLTPEIICQELLANRPTRVGENIIHRLNDLDLLHNRRLSESGRDALEQGLVFMPERSSYRIMWTEDPLLPQKLLDLSEEAEIPHWDPARKKNKGKDPAVDVPKGLKEIEGSVVQLLGSEGGTIRVEKIEGKCIPQEASSGTPLTASVTVRMGNNNELTLSGRYQRRMEPPSIDFDDVWMRILLERAADWNKKEMVLQCSFDDLSDSDRRSFTTTLELKTPTLPNLGRFNRTVVRNVPIAPRDSDDAQLWADWLLVDRMPGYLSENEFEVHKEQVAANFPVHQLRLPGQEELADTILQNEWKWGEGGPLRKEYWYLRAPIDLNPGGD
jgi:hypothetical protein